MDKLFIVVPAYNEEENIQALVEDWYPVAERCGSDSRLVVVNDGSKDHTLEKLSGLQDEHPQLTVLTKENGGHGSALMHGYRYALEQGADFVFQTDSDGQTDPAEFSAFWEMRDKYAAVIGFRPDRQDGTARKFVEWTLLQILRVTFGVKVPDSNAPFRLMSREILATYLPKLPADFNLPNVMLTTYFAYYKENIRFEKISFKPRKKGKNSINIKRIVKIGCQAVGDFRKLRKEL